MTQTLVRVATCTDQPGPLGKTEMAGPANRCLLPDGVTSGYVTFVSVYVSDQPIEAGSVPAAPFDYAYAGALWALAFTTVVSLHIGAHLIGNILGFIRRG